MSKSRAPVKLKPFTFKKGISIKKPTGHETFRFADKFLWLPKKLGGEIRWLESCTILEKLVNNIWTEVEWSNM